MQKLFRLFLAGALLSLGLLASQVMAGNIATFTGPAGATPSASPQNNADYNTIINGVNNNASFQGTGVPSGVIGATLTTSTSLGIGSAQTTILQIVNTTAWTTSTSASCKITGAMICLGIFDSTGVLRWLGAQ